MHERDLERSLRDDHTAQTDHATPGRTPSSAGLARREQPTSSGILMRSAEGEGGDAEAATELAAMSSGSALPEALREQFEGSLGTDLSGVRVHTDGAAGEAASAVSARAFALGQDVYFGAGQYNPGSSSGQHLIAHEVAHTVQQRGGSTVRQDKPAISAPQDTLEVEADRAADAMVAGRPAQVTTSAPLIARRPDNGHAPPPPPGMPSPLTDLNPVAAAVKAGEASGQGSIPSPAGLYNTAESNYSRFAGHCSTVQEHYTMRSKADVFENHHFKGFAKTAGEANKYCEQGAVLANAASSAISMWVSLLQNSQDGWAEVKQQADKCKIDTVANEDGSTSLDGDAVENDGQELKGKNHLVTPKNIQDAAPDASAKEKAAVKDAKAESANDIASGKNIESQSRVILDEAETNFEQSTTAVNRSRGAAITAHGAARKSLLNAKSKANAKKQSDAEADMTAINEILGMVDKAQGAIEGGMGAVTSFADGEHGAMEKGVDGLVAGHKASAAARTILTLDGTIPKIEAAIIACKTADENLKGIIDEGTIQSAGAAFANALKAFKEDLKTLKDRAAKYEKAHKAYAEVVNQALMKRGLLKPGEDGVEPLMVLLAKVKIASAATSSAVAAGADVLAAVSALNALGAPPSPDLCKLAPLAASHKSKFATAPKRVGEIQGVLAKREAKLKDYAAKLKF